MKKPVALLCALVCCASLLLPPALAEEGIVLDNSAFELEAPTSPPFVPEATPHVTLQKGSSGEAVMRLQQRLTELGFYYGKISGNFLDGTDAATRDFQQRNGLAINGKVTATTWNAIMSRDALGKDGQKHAPADGNAYAVAQPTPPPVVVIGAEATPAPPDSGAVFGRKLQYDSQGEDVRALQSRLQALGYYNAEISGNFYGNTRDAVRAFQRQNALKVDGIVGEETHRTLWDDTLAINVWSTPRPTPTPVPPMYLLKVDVTNQVTTAYTMDEQGDYTVPFRRMICSTGTKSNPTPLNTTVSKGARARWGYFPEWGSHAQYLTRIDSKNAFHSVLYSEPDPMQLVVGAYNALGSRASHGCVRLLVEDAKWIYDNCPNGTTITVYEGDPDPELREMLKPPPLDRQRMLPKATPEPTPPPVWDASAAPPAYRKMNRGTNGPDVWWLQMKLTTLGYYHGTVTGGYHEGTQAAVKAFQRDAGLSVDGTAGVKTLTALYENPAYASPVAVPATQSPFQNVAPLPTPVPVPPSQTQPPEPEATPAVYG